MQCFFGFYKIHGMEVRVEKYEEYASPGKIIKYSKKDEKGIGRNQTMPSDLKSENENELKRTKARVE